MSRTDKDRPYRVVDADPHVLRTAHHDHLRFGKEVYRARVKRDAAGKPVMTTEVYTARAYPSALPVSRVREVPVYEQVLVGVVADHCTIGEAPITEDGGGRRDWLVPCYYRAMFYPYGRPNSIAKQLFHSEARRAEREALSEARRFYNSSSVDEWDDFEADESLSARTRTHLY